MSTHKRFFGALLFAGAIALLPGCEFFQQLGPYDEVPLDVTVRNGIFDEGINYTVVVTGPFSGTFNLSSQGGQGHMRGTARDGATFSVNATTTVAGEDNVTGSCTFQRSTMRALQIVLDDHRGTERVGVFCYGF